MNPSRRLKKLLVGSLLFLNLLLSGSVLLQPAYAQNTSTANCPDNTESVNGICVPKSPYGTSGAIASSKDLSSLIISVIKILLITSGAIAVLIIIIGGFWYVTSAGNEEQAEKGRKTLLNAVIGMVVIILAYAIVNVVVGTLTK